MDTNCSFKFPKTVDKVVDGIVTNDSNQFFTFTKTGMMIACNIACGKTKIHPPFNHNGFFELLRRHRKSWMMKKSL